MNADSLNQIANSVEQYITMLRQRAEDIKRQISDVENHKGKLKQRIVAQVSAAMTNDVTKDMTAHLIDERYRLEQKAGDEQAKTLKDMHSNVQKHMGETESIYSELRRYEASLRDLESKASSYASRAQDLMSRGAV